MVDWSYNQAYDGIIRCLALLAAHSGSCVQHGEQNGRARFVTINMCWEVPAGDHPRTRQVVVSRSEQLAARGVAARGPAQPPAPPGEGYSWTSHTLTDSLTAYAVGGAIGLSLRLEQSTCPSYRSSYVLRARLPRRQEQ